MKITLDFGYYDGEVVDEKFNGKGIFYYTNGDKYDGEWVNDKKHGKGTQYYANGDKYDGEWADDVEHGNGVYTKANGQMLTGLFERGKFVGNPNDKATVGATIKVLDDGATLYSTHDKYNECDVGVAVYPDGKLVIGLWKDGERILNKSWVYEPTTDKELSFPRCSSAKTVKHATGVYDGEVLDTKAHGVGTFTWNSGTVYTGEWINGSRTGKGYCIFGDGSRYDGELVKGKYNGYGRHVYSNGDRYVGEWVDSLPYGYGAKFFKNGDIHIGSVINGRFDGVCAYICANGEVKLGVWINDKLSNYFVKFKK